MSLACELKVEAVLPEEIVRYQQCADGSSVHR